MKKKILYGIIALIILIGIVMFFVHDGFNIGSVYGKYTKLSLYIENGINDEEVRNIAKECFENRDIVVQDIEYFGEMVLITMPYANETEIENFLAKINEKYSLEYSKDDLSIINMPGLTFKEVVNPYILPITLSVVLAIVYVAIRYYSLGIFKMIAKTLLTFVLSLATILSVYLIFNFPIDLSIVPAVLVGIAIAIVYVTSNNNKLLEAKKVKEQE